MSGFHLSTHSPGAVLVREGLNKIGCDSSDVIDSLRLRPVPLEHFEAPLVAFGLQHRLDAGALEPLVEPAHTGEQAGGLHRASSRSAASTAAWASVLSLHR